MAGSFSGDHTNATWLMTRTPYLYDWYDDYPYDLQAWYALCRQHGGPVLDMACGTGRVAIELARQGITVVGVDFSPAMLARAKEKLGVEGRQVARRVSFVLGDMTDFSLRRRFRTVVMPCFSFHELGTLSAQEACLRAISRHLAVDGTLAIALAVWRPVAATTPPEQPCDLGPPKEEGYNPHTGLFTRMWVLTWADVATQTQYHRFHFEEQDEHGAVVRSFSHPEFPGWNRRRFLCRYEMELLLEKCGFATDMIYGNWDLSPFDSGSSCMLFVARKVARSRKKPIPRPPEGRSRAVKV